MKHKKSYTVNQYAKLKHIDPQTVRDWCNKNLIKYERTLGGHRRIIIEDEIEDTKTICYCRVSSYKQKDDLKRQIKFMESEFPNAKIISDIGSGLNFKRKGFRTILESCMQGNRIKLIVAHRDRLGRFAFDLIKWIVERSEGEILVLDKTEHSPEQELTKDLLSILHVFSCRLHGLRSYKTKIDKALSNKGTKKDI